MKNFRIILVLLIFVLFFYCKSKSEESPAPVTGILAAGATVQKLSGDFSFTEGPACDSEGNVYFTDQPNDRIMKWSINGELTTYLTPSGRSNGLTFDGDGFLWACADEKNELWRIDSAKQATVVVKDYQGKLLNGPNDVWVHPDGGVYFTDPYYARNWWPNGRTMEQDCQGVYYLTSDLQSLKRVIADLQQPNGIIGTPDGNMLYIADIGAGKTYSYSMDSEGNLTNKQLFCEMGSDGMTIDNQGNVYLTGNGVFVFDKSGKQVEHIAIPESWTANVCFGGADMQTLFITASKGLYSHKMNVKGVGSQ